MKVTLDVGPRIIYAALDGGENIFFNDIQRLHQRSGDFMESAFDKGDVWYIYGGTRLWFSPENAPLSYYPDNSKVDYKVDKNSVTFTPKVQKVTCMQQSITLCMDDKLPKVKVDYSALNKGEETRKYALWALSVCKGGIAIIPQPKDKTGLLANRVISLWEYTDMADERLLWGKDYIAVNYKNGDISPLKIGINNTSGKLGFIHGSTLFIKRYSPDHQTLEYPDYGVSSEIYTCKDFTEVETLSALNEYKPAQSHTHTEEWEFIGIDSIPEFKNDSIKAFADKYI